MTWRRSDARPWLHLGLAFLIASAGLIALVGSSFNGLFAILCLVLAAIFTYICRLHPKWAFCIWLLAAFLAPPWIFLQLSGVRLPIVTVLAVLFLVSSYGIIKWQFSKADLVVLSLAVSLVANMMLTDTPQYFVLQGVGEWVVCFFAGVAFSRRYAVRVPFIVALGTIFAVAAVLQYVYGFNVADTMSTSARTSADFWKTLQFRSGEVRAELTFGHSIALGGTLALLLPFVSALNSVPLRITAGAAIFLGILATQSRAALVAAAIALSLMILSASRIAIGWKAILALIPIMVFFLSGPQLIRSVLLGDGNESSEVVQGTEYRVDALTLFEAVNLGGVGDGAFTSSTGSIAFKGNFVSIDNATLYVALYAGGIVAALYVLVFIMQVLPLSRPSWHPARIALIAQIPLYLTVAPITQYQSLLWLVLGISSQFQSAAMITKSRGVVVA